MSTRRVIIAGFAVAAVLTTACQSPSNKGLQTAQRNEKSAREANERGLKFVDADKFNEAEAAFREAIQHDLRYAAAHNNLGLVLLTQGNLYHAAVEFRMASRLDPNAKEPVENLAQLYQRLGWEKEARKLPESTRNREVSE